VAQGDAALIINGGDVYETGTDADFAAFAQEMGNNLSLMCETPGNHDWKTHTQSPDTGLIPSGYEKFWKAHAPPHSKQPIDTTKKGGARYEHFIDLDGWRLIFLNTATSGGSEGVWPAGDAGRIAWLRQAVQSKPGRAKIVFAHHSRLSCGAHPDNPEIDAIWQELFDANGAPLAACTVAGHNHNVGLYKPRPRNHPESSGPVPFAQGIYMMVNGASGVGFYTPDKGTMPDLFFDFVSCCVTRITLENAQKAQFDVLSFGHRPSAHTVPHVIKD
jgi:cold shock CspA family protein